MTSAQGGLDEEGQLGAEAFGRKSPGRVRLQLHPLRRRRVGH